ncbi:leucyl/phenylalanyl-tRNA--protein transferase [Xenorhabdus doucetiae]|uniref:Leucyl/phenylalanyl-tRNA--protein transferase n=1 Tax=Xenorhabdus doucetiae TaxID=351671 RepID=A0A068QRM5_9GAMM|nr:MULTISPECIES: leucyl/phenylalanyl-tRNA--protein transferase [Xenorhabdus]MBD2784274.1 leucyl/phenylalanyl-tRNA--protein transferase [Xenorhabdus sp. 3]MBD2789111.1 leucyl/phenylalanyl-tRNA--protein transferase [Xenorhabdus sp. DI]MBD2796947.1 leucyl/phenylalanyl-tRNA--protein transferase [Xenorhabdus sp. 18]TYP17156.1 leucyl/phenylalanyl-tRNA--protein transferase [Xenorhabdus doucetiae]CDG17251.1 Leucyl/phenylalanyl-tRNA--protein transferase [Xenorhabdus doucetiae]
MSIAQLDNSYEFPHPTNALAEPNGLLAFGGDLSAERLRVAYHEGIFPWYSPDEPPLWWSPDPRAVLIPGELHIGRTLRRFIRKHIYQITVNYAFDEVIYHCAQRQEGTWIGPDVQKGYQTLHKEGLAHSIEVWHDHQLVGGLYGVCVGTLFCGESMFSKMENASKCAFVAFYHHFLRHSGQLFDCQVLNHHTESLGAKNIPREKFLQHLYQLRKQSLQSGCWSVQKLDL